MSKIRTSNFQLLLVLNSWQKSEFLKFIKYFIELAAIEKILVWNLLIYIYTFIVLGDYSDPAQPWTL